VEVYAEFPAAATRELGWPSDLALLCGHEINVPGALARCLRVLMLVNTERAPGEIRHVYLGEARKLKDLTAAELDKENSTSVQYKIIDTLVSVTGRIRGFSYWFAVILITVIVKILLTPLTKAQFKSMKEMKRQGEL
jgi:hypothetical protein